MSVVLVEVETDEGIEGPGLGFELNYAVNRAAERHRQGYGSP